MKKCFSLIVFSIMVVFCPALTSCNSNSASSNQYSNSQYGDEESESSQYSDEESESSQYILTPSTLYEGIFNGGFSTGGILTTDAKNNETSFKIKAYKDGGITFSFDNKVYVKGWGHNMSGEVEGKWDIEKFSYHDVEYNVMVIKCKQSIYPTYYEDSNHTPTDFRLAQTIIVEMIVDNDLNFYFTEDALINHIATGKLVRK